MSSSEASAILNDVVIAVQDVRQTFRGRKDVSDVLNAFWCLQDQLRRLVEHASDHPREALTLMESEHRHLVGDVAELLSFTLKLNIAQLPAVNQSCSAINDSLQSLEHLKYEPRTRAASAG